MMIYEMPQRVREIIKSHPLFENDGPVHPEIVALLSFLADRCAATYPSVPSFEIVRWGDWQWVRGEWQRIYDNDEDSS